MQRQRKTKELPPRERAKTRLRALPKRECANWSEAGCYGGRYVCSVEKGQRCSYFERCILPIHGELTGEYKKEVEGGV